MFVLVLVWFIRQAEVYIWACYWDTLCSQQRKPGTSRTRSASSWSKRLKWAKGTTSQGPCWVWKTWGTDRTAAISSVGICSSGRLISPRSTDLQALMNFFPHFSLDNSMCTAGESNTLKSLFGASHILRFRQGSLILSFFPHRHEHLRSRYHHSTARTQLQDRVPSPARWSNPASDYCLHRTQALSWATQAALRLGLRVTLRRAEHIFSPISHWRIHHRPPCASLAPMRTSVTSQQPAGIFVQ